MSDYSSLITKRKLSAAIQLLDVKHNSKRAKINPPPISTPALQSLLPPTPAVPVIPPSYEPTSLSALVNRISTFKLSTYQAPITLSPLIAASNGWTNVPPIRNRLECITCKSTIIIAPPFDGKVGEKMIEKYLEMMKGEGHLRGCPWTVGGCRASLYSVLAKREGRNKVLEELVERLETIRGDIVVKELLDSVVTKELKGKVENWLKLNEKEIIVKENSLILALLGWSVDTLSQNPADNTLHCHLCTRTILLQPYLENSTKPFDPISQHQLFCAYIQPRGDNLVGWRKSLEVILGSKLSKSNSELSLIDKNGKSNTKELLERVRDVLSGSKKMR